MTYQKILIETFESFDEEEEENELDLFKTSAIHLEKCYFINFEKFFFYIYDFEKNIPVEVKGYEKKSQIDLVINEENNDKESIFPSFQNC